MRKIVTVYLGGPENPVLVQGELLHEEENGLTLVQVSDKLTVWGKRTNNEIAGTLQSAESD